MAHSFITNRDRLLSDIITGILPKSDAVDILVGYFYFSGYAHLADKLADKYLRILVGLDIDTRISNRVREVEELVEWQRIRSKVREEYFNNLVRLINETDNTDTDETIRMFRQFQRKIYDGTLEIRKTEDPCHAKMYLFAYNDSNNENGEQPLQSKEKPLKKNRLYVSSEKPNSASNNFLSAVETPFVEI